MAPRNDNRSAHKRRVATANAINKVYKRSYNRRNTKPRGLVNPGNYCYRNAVLQALAHLPRLINWIMEHSPAKKDDPPSPATAPTSDTSPKAAASSKKKPTPPPSTGKKWICSEDDPNRYQPVNDDLMAKIGPFETGCVPCLLKNLFRKYWMKHQMDPNDHTDDSEPMPFNADDEALLQLHNLSDRWFCRDPEGWEEIVKEEEERRKSQNERIEKDNKVAGKKNAKIERKNRETGE